MYHSLKFVKGNVTKNTWDDWHLIPASLPVIAQPTYNQKYVDIPGKDSALDISDYLTGSLTYSDRTGSIEFYVLDNYLYGQWETLRSQLASFFDGSSMRMFLTDDDPNYYYEGRVILKEWRSEQSLFKVIIEYRVKPYKYSVSNGAGVL